MIMTDVPTKPTPPPSDLSKPYWDAAANGQLLIQVCAACGVKRHYPRLLCDQCYSDEVHWQQLSGHGTIHSWTVAHHAYHPAFAHELPYTLVTVDLTEGTRALGCWYGETPHIGQPVKGEFETGDGPPVLVFASHDGD